MTQNTSAVKPAWVMEREIRDSAVPVDRRIHPSHWDGSIAVSGDALIKAFWGISVPGSSAPEIPYQGMVQ
ncbi:MAG: hypothetical protein ABFD14_11715, partial [Anaerolineaceae bacterium]